jgi:hypothetical protein
MTKLLNAVFCTYDNLIQKGGACYILNDFYLGKLALRSTLFLYSTVQYTVTALYFQVCKIYICLGE